MASNGSGTDAVPEGVILPPAEIKAIIEKTAQWIAKSDNPDVFEEKIRAREKTDTRFAFAVPTDPYNAYYKWRLEQFKTHPATAAVPSTSGTAAQQADAALNDAAAAANAKAGATIEKPEEPPAFEFLVADPPTINAVDLDILRLTALFTARSGKKFAQELANREGRNYQFDFLRPSHSLFSYFNTLVDQYTKILIPSKEYLASIERKAGGSAQDTSDPDERRIRARRNVLEDAQKRVKWESYELSLRQQEEDKAEQERISFAQIDWQDFITVATIEFTEGEEAGVADLPPPMSLSDIENMSLAQKKMAAMIVGGAKEEDVKQAMRELEQEQQQGQQGDAEEMDMTIDDDDEDDAAVAAKEKERQSAPEIKAAQPGPIGNIKVRKDYVPKAKRGPQKAGPQYTKVGDQLVRVDEFTEHMRYELLDPKWREQRREMEANRSASNLVPEGTDVGASIRELAAHRPDIFGPGVNDDERKKREADAKAASKARVANVWDGHTATAETVQNRFNANANLEEQIEALHRAKGLVGVEDDNRIGPVAPGTLGKPTAADGTDEKGKVFVQLGGGQGSVSAGPSTAAVTSQYGQYQKTRTRTAGEAGGAESDPKRQRMA